MNWKKLIPWDWFKHEDKNQNVQTPIPVNRGTGDQSLSINHPILQLHDEIERIFNESLQRFGMTTWNSGLFAPDTLLRQSDFKPSLNVSSGDKNYVISVEMPGMDEKDISIELNDEVLTIKGEKKEEKEEQEGYFYRTERRYGSFQRILSLPQDSDTNNIDAKMKDGILTLHIPRLELDESHIKKIAIN